MSLLFFNIRSSSQGNCTYIGNHEEGILVDCGITAKCVQDSLNLMGVDPKSIRAILITHEHSDHISGVKVLAKQLSVPIMATGKTLAYMEQKKKIETGSQLIEIFPKQNFFLNSFEILPFSVPHDAVDPVGYRIFTGGYSAACVTDLGYFPKRVCDMVSGSDVILLESNHDLQMIQETDKYPSFLKKRIQGKKGHMSNLTCAEATLKLSQLGTKQFLLGHLSQNTNTYEIAYHTTQQLMQKEGAVQGEDYTLDLARHDASSRIYYFK
ncbi:MAG: MBL fold metallo-hydrolase [Eubacteriales bacterium]|nr:MBL fold metallo-hydrolase [Eubacteriales bacterium]